MTSVSQPISAAAPASDAASPSSPAGASASDSHAAPAASVSGAGKGSYASATKKSVKPVVGGVQATGKADITAANNARINPAVPTALVNGAGSAHRQSPSVTIDATAAPGYLANGAHGAARNKGGIQFGDMQAEASEAGDKSNASAGETAASPAASPSPIPQPLASGGRPPSSIHGHSSNNLSFGQFGDARMHPLASNSHLRRESSQSQHSDMSNPPTRGGFPAGRGRGYGPAYPPSMAYSPSTPYRQPSFQGRSASGMPPFHQQQQPPPGQQTRSFSGYPGQPGSPMPPNARMMSQPGPGAPYANFSEQQAYGFNPQQQMGYGMPPQQMDPAYMAQWYHAYGQHAPPPQMGPQSPRPNSQLPPGGSPFPPHPYHAPASMSRTSSNMSDRPGSSMGKNKPPPSRSLAAAVPALAPKTPSFQKPKKSAGIVIKDPNSGEVVDLKHAAATVKPPSPVKAIEEKTERSSEPKLERPKADGNDLKAQLERQLKAREAESEKKEEPDVQEPEIPEEKEVKAAVEEKPTQIEAKDQPKEAAAPELKSEEPPEPKPEEPKLDEIDEDEIARWEAEAAEEERREREREEAYAKRKQAERDEAARKEAESFKMADEEMKRAEREAEEAEERRLKEAAGEDKAENDPESTPDLAAETESTSEAAAEPPAEHMAESVSERKGSIAKTKPSALVLDTQKSVEPPQPSAALLSLRSARKLLDLSDISYPQGVVPPSPNPALNQAAPAAGKFIYDRDFLLQFKNAFKEAPAENWDTKFKETVGDSKSGGSSMGSRSASRNAVPGSSMGNFAPPRLGPGSTSAQRFDASTRSMGMMGVKGAMPMMGGYTPARTGGFPQPMGTMAMARSPSSTSLHNASRNPSQRAGSQRGSRAAPRREDPKDNKAMPLTAGGNIKPIEVTSTGWKPRSVGAGSMTGPAPGGENLLAPDEVQRKVKSNLNKMTPNNFDKITGQILEIAQQSKYETDGRSLRQVIQLTFEKATDEAHWAEMYAQFCKRMLESMSPEIKDENILDKKGEVVVGGALFRKYLLTRCQTEFERGWKMNLPERPEGEGSETTMLSEEYYIAAAAKRRGLGLVRFIGELYKLQMLTERIMHECVKKLVDYEGTPDEAEVESLTSLLKTIGQQLDASEKNQPFMNACFDRINRMIELKDLPSRLKFMLMDIVDLRQKNRWQPKGGAVIKGPTTLDEVRAQAVEQERQKEIQRTIDSSRRGPGGGSSRPPMGKGDARNFAGGGMMPPPDYQRNHVDVGDLRRLGSRNASRQAASSQGPQLGPPSMFAGSRGSNRSPMGIVSAASGASSRAGTPSSIAAKEKKDKEEATKAGSNAFSALASIGSAEAVESTSESPSIGRDQPAATDTPEESPASKPEESG